MAPPVAKLKFVPYGRAMFDIQAGDLVQFRARPWSRNPRTWAQSLVGSLITWFGRGGYCHSGKVIHLEGMYFVAEMVEGAGGRLYPLRKYAESHSGYLDVYRPTDPAFNNRGAIRQMLRMVGRPYGWRALAKAFCLHLPFVRNRATRIADERPHDGPLYCSAAVAYADKHGGFVDPVDNLATEHTEPSDLSRGHLYGPNYVLTIVADDPNDEA